MKLQLSFVLFGLATAAKLPAFQLASIDGVKRLGGDDGVSVEQVCSPGRPYSCSLNNKLCCSTNVCCAKECCASNIKWCVDGICVR